MPVAVLALDREERFARPDRARVDREPRHVARQRARARGPHGGRHGVEGPERLVHATFSFSAAATASWSLNGNDRVADNLAAFMALSGNQQDISGLQAPQSRC